MRNTRPNVCIAFFYCDGNDPEKQNPRFIFGSIIRQMLEQSQLTPENPIMVSLKQFYRDHKLDTFESRSSLERLLCQITSIAATFREVFIILDGLDECSPREHLLQIIMRLIRRNIRVLTASRPERDIEETFPSHLPRIEMDEATVNVDIAAHIDFKLENNPKLRKMASAFKEETKNVLMEKGAGM
jgi:hypothetical protein